MLDIEELFLSLGFPYIKREDRFYIVGEDDGKGSIILHKVYLYNPKRKERPIKMPVKDFLPTAICFHDGIYEAHYLPPEKRESAEVYERRFKRFKKFLEEHPEEDCSKEYKPKKRIIKYCKKSFPSGSF